MMCRGLEGQRSLGHAHDEVHHLGCGLVVDGVRVGNRLPGGTWQNEGSRVHDQNLAS